MKIFIFSFKTLFCTLAFLNVSNLIAQSSTNELPVSFNLSGLTRLSGVKSNKTLPALNMVLIEQEDLAEEASMLPPKFGYPHLVNYNLNNSGRWDTLQDGSRIWRLNIECPNALSINIVYDSFWLPNGTKFFVYSQDKSKHIGAFTAANNQVTKNVVKGFATGLIWSNKITLEYYEPMSVEQGIVSVSAVVHGYRNFGNSAPCNVNINCSEGDNWQFEKNGVAMIVVGEHNNRICTGALVNTTANDNRPLFLTANHCISEMPYSYDAIDNPNINNNWMFYWNYESENCENSVSEPFNFETSTSGGGIVLANNSTSDFALLKLAHDPRFINDRQLFYLGWDNSEEMTSGGVCIHHPRGDVKKISTYTMTPLNSSCNGNMFWQVRFAPTTTNNHYSIVEPGSSGSPLINNNKKIIGQLYGPGYCPSLTCDNGTFFGFDLMSRPVSYGKFSVSWTGNGATDNRRKLQPWLDPINSGANSIDGMNRLPFDLMVRDSISDNGSIPNNIAYCWVSPDIWVRNNDDNGLEHQNPEYSPNKPNWVYVRVTNVGGMDNLPNDAKLELYWAKASTALTWEHWTGATFPNSTVLRGDTVGCLPINQINIGKSTIIKFPWIVPNPADYEEINSEPWHFCLLTRIISEIDTMTYQQTSHYGNYVLRNNNIAMKNLTIVDVASGDIASAVAVGNAFSVQRTFDLLFKSPTNETGRKAHEEAEISITLDNALASKWQASGRQGSNVERKRDGKILVKGANAVLNNLTFSPNEINTVNLSFNFLTKQVSNKENYNYSVVLQDNETGEIIGGENYLIKREARSLFRADAGSNKEVDKNETFTLSANLISEDAVYNWYDNNDSLIYEGIDFTTSTEIAQTYHLEVIALADGYKDYANVEVTIKPNRITNIYPNPASSIANIEYSITDATTAYLSIVNYYNSQINNNYILNIDSDARSLDIQSYPTGIYVVSLICNGQIADSKILVKQ